ncbi:phage terminase small subunit, partial [Escherichia coli]
TGGHRRTTPYLLAEEVALSAQRLLDAKQPVGLPLLLDTIALTERADMPDIVRAKLHKITGYVLREAGRLTDALTHLQRAIQLER